jgi:hypothetical protein
MQRQELKDATKNHIHQKSTENNIVATNLGENGG